MIFVCWYWTAWMSVQLKKISLNWLNELYYILFYVAHENNTKFD